MMSITAPAPALQMPGNVPPTVRQLSEKELGFIAREVAEAQDDNSKMNTLLAPLRNASLEQVQNHKGREYSRLMFKGGQKAPRRYFARPATAGFDIFAIYFQAKEEESIETYEAYRDYFLSTVSEDSLLTSLFMQAFALKPLEELRALFANKQAWNQYWETMSIWVAKSFIHTIWQGKRKEELFHREASEYLAGTEWNLRETTPQQDMKFMIDFTLEENGKVIAGISVKGKSYVMGKANGSQYLESGEVRERKGHQAFFELSGAKTHVIISAPELPQFRESIHHQLDKILEESTRQKGETK